MEVTSRLDSGGAALVASGRVCPKRDSQAGVPGHPVICPGHSVTFEFVGKSGVWRTAR